jgi:23S rRNA pseudouridine2457 synthase
MKTIVFHKPYGVLSHFTGKPGQRTLSEFIDLPGVYAAGRLDMDSEGLLILTSDGKLAQRISDPNYKHPKTYLVQVEGMVTDDAVSRLRAGIAIKNYVTLPCDAKLIPEPAVYERVVRGYHPTCWLKITLFEGKNRQVRRMTAAVGFPTLRLIRTAIGPVSLGNLEPGKWRVATQSEIKNIQDVPMIPKPFQKS